MYALKFAPLRWFAITAGCLILPSTFLTSNLQAQSGTHHTAAHPTAHPAASARAQDNLLVDKINAYVEAYNQIHWPFAKDAEEYQQENAFLLNPKGIRRGNYLQLKVPTGDGHLEDPIAKLKDGLAMKTAVPEVDLKAQALLDTLQDLNARVEQAQNYSTTVGVTTTYKADDWAKAVDFSPKLIAAYQAADKNTDAFIEALDNYKLQRELAKLAAMKPGSFSYLWLKDSLDTRRVDNAFRKALTDPNQTADLSAALQTLTTTNKSLQQFMQTPAYDRMDMNNGCAMYADATDNLIAQLSEVSKELTPAINNEQKHDIYNAYIQHYNDTIENHNMCAPREHRVVQY